MKQFLGWSLAVCACLVAFLCVLSAHFTPVTERERQAALAALEEAGVFDLSTGLEERDALGDSNSTESASDLSPVSEGTLGQVPAALTPRECQEAYARLVASITSALGSEGSLGIISGGLTHYRSLSDAGGGARAKGKAREDAVAFIKSNAALLSEIHSTLALDGSPFISGSDVGMLDLLKMARDLRYAVWPLCLDACYRVHEREDPAGAARDFQSGLRLARVLGSLGNCATSIEQRRVTNTLYLYYEVLFSGVRAPVKEMDVLIAQLNQERSTSAPSQEIASDLRFILQSREQWKAKGYREQIDDFGILTGTRSWLWTRLLFRPFFNQSERTVIEIIGRMIEAVKLPYSEAKPRLEVLFSEVDDLSLLNAHLKSVLRMRLVSYLGHLYNNLKLDLLRTAIAAERHYAEHGAYPPDLDSLAEVLGGSIPVSPFTGAPYVYEPLEEKFLLYAVVQESNFWLGRELDEELRDDDVTFGMSDYYDEDVTRHPSEYDLVEAPIERDGELIVWRTNLWWRVVGGQIGDAERWLEREESDEGEVGGEESPVVEDESGGNSPDGVSQ